MTADYKTNDPKGWCGDASRGAAMGRPSIATADPLEPVKMTLQKVRLDNGGYDTNGTYFGWSRGSDVYWYANGDGTIDRTLRAESRKDARAQVTAEYPKARFFN